LNIFQNFLKPGTPVFNPKVTPDPTEWERLEVKLDEARRQLNMRLEKSAMRRSRRIVIGA